MSDNSISKANGLFYRFLASKVITQALLTAFIIFYMWKIVSESHSVFLAGLIIVIYTAIQLGFSIPLGHLIDRFNNTILNITSSAIIIIGFAVLFLGDNLLLIYLAASISVLGQTLKGDSFSAIIKKHLPEALFKKANSMNTAFTSIFQLVGTALGGIFIIVHPELFPLVIFLVSIFAILLLKIEREEIQIGRGQGIAIEFRSVGNFLRRIAGILVLAFFLNGLLISMDTYASGIFNLVLKTSPIYYTIFSFSLPLGTIAGTPVTNMKPMKEDKPSLIASLLILFSPLVLGISISRSPILDIFDGFIVGFIIPIINIPITTKLMKSIPREIFGKVMAFIRVFTAGATPVMGAIFSVLAIFMKITTVLLGVGILVVPLTIYSLIIIPRFFNS